LYITHGLTLQVYWLLLFISKISDRDDVLGVYSAPVFIWLSLNQQILLLLLYFH